MRSGRLDGQPICVEIEEGVAVVTMRRPPVNAFTSAMFAALRAALAGIARDPSCRAVILTGKGRCFCAGSEIDGFLDQTEDEAAEDLALIRITFNALQDCPVPVIAAVNGAAMGTGMVLAALADIRIASEKAVFALPEIKVGAMGGIRHVMRIAPQGIARLMAFTGCRIDAAAAWHHHLVERVVAPERLMDEAREIARQITASSPEVMRLAKAAANRVEEMGLREAYEHECGIIASLRSSPQAREAALAFVEKRKPDFSTSG
ncbi:enoyl-CoA hydratase [Hoeflea sp. BAL378]|nr:enoyl-CoA hydratase [Hoeflea sp. BAL378]